MVLMLLAGCGGMQQSGRGQALRAGEMARNPASGLAVKAAIAPGALAYASEFTPDGRTLASVELFGTFALAIRIDGEPVRKIPLGPVAYNITDLAMSPSGALAWVASRAGTVRAFDIASGTVATTWHLGSPVTAIAISPDGAYAAMGTQTGVVCLRRIHDGALLQCMTAHEGQISSLDFDAEGSRLASASFAGELGIWAMPSLAQHAHATLGGAINDVAFSPEGDRIAIARSPFPALVTPAIARRLADDSDRARGRVDVLPASLGPALFRLPGHERAATTVAWLGNERLISGGWDGALRLWNPTAPTPHALATLTGLGTLIRDVAVAPGGHRLSVATWVSAVDEPAMFVVDVLYPKN